MALKKPSEQNARKPREVTEAEAEALANRLAERPYGGEPTAAPAESVNTLPQLKRTSISLPADLLLKVEDTALKNKRQGAEPKSVSAIIREALNAYFIDNK